MSTDMDIFMDMMSDIDTPFCETVEQGQNNSYYQGLGIHILKQLQNKDHYFHFLQSILSDYHKLSKDQQIIIQESMNIQTKTIVKEKIIIKQPKKKQKKQLKPKLNTDDY